MNDLYDVLKERALALWEGARILEEPVTVRAVALSTEEAIGNPEADDFPLQKGKERLMQAGFGKGLGQAFTDRFGDFEGTLKEVLEMSLDNNYRRAVFVATLNAVLRHMDQVKGTIHCRDQEPKQCGTELAEQIKMRYGRVNVGQVGFQPRMVESLAAETPLRLLDLDPDNVGTRKFQVLVEGPEATDDIIAWADLLLVTGTTLVNRTIEQFLGKKPVLFYGTTIAGAAHLMGWDRFCARGH